MHGGSREELLEELRRKFGNYFYQFSKHSLIIILRFNKSISDASSTTDGKASRPSTGASAKNLFVP